MPIYVYIDTIKQNITWTKIKNRWLKQYKYVYYNKNKTKKNRKNIVNNNYYPKKELTIW